MKSRKRLRRIIFSVVAFGLLAVLIATNTDDIGQTWRLLQQVDLRYVALLPVLQILSYSMISLYFRYVFKSFKKDIPFKNMLGIIMALNFVNQILPSGGLSGVTYLIYGLRRYNISAGTASLTQLGRYLLSYVSYFLIMIVAVIFLFFGDQNFNRLFIYILLIALITFALIGGLLFVVASKKRIRIVVGSIGRFIDKISEKLRKGKPVFGLQTIEKTLSDFHEGFSFFRKDIRRLAKPIFFMLLSSLFEVLLVYCSFLAVGAHINPGIIFVAFTAANAAGVLSVIPGDVGVHEAAIVTVLALMGVDSAVAISATLLYRVFNKMIFVTLGFLLYNRLLKSAKKPLRA